ncbi:MAG TPA: glycoside hydrolase family 13 protein [Ktedonobacterales bacterium]|nr:glycoside hydrolase family 13 protein [Ktedonobacterales bacterium]
MEPAGGRTAWWASRRFIVGALVAVVVVALSAGIAAFRSAGAGGGGPINQAALLHDTRDLAYRSPFGAVPTGQAVTLTLRAAAGNVASAKLRVWDQAALGGHGDAIWYDARVAATRDGYDFWRVTLPAARSPRMLAYKWQLSSGRSVVWYEDHYDRAHGNCDPVGGVGQVFVGLAEPDCPFHLNIYQAGFTVPDWVKHAVIYQIFVDRFFNGTTANDALVQPNRYDGACAGPSGANAPTGYYLHTNWSEEPITPPQNCDFFGGDLQGVIAKLDYLHTLGVNTLYLNPIFMADSNHKYDTTDYTMIDPHFGNLAVWKQLVDKTKALGMHIILDGVFNHTSSDSVYFDRYHVWNTQGADVTQSSPYADWYQFTTWPNYNGWFGVDSLPQLSEKPATQAFIFAGDPHFVAHANDAAIRQKYGEQPLVVPSGADSVAKYWLAEGAAGWRLDAADQKSDAWWQAFRAAIKAFDPEAIAIGEHWGDASEWLLGNEEDGVMNYRFRAAVLGFFDGGGIDPDTGHDSMIPYTASQFNDHLQAVLEEYPLPAVYASMNLVDSHDVGRILWELGDTPGATPDQVALAQQKLKAIALFQMTWIGAPTIYYGDEAGQTQTTYANTRVDPGDRRTFPWDHPDTTLADWYRLWIGVRAAHPVLATGAEKTLLTDDGASLFAFQRSDASGLALVVINGGAPDKPQTATLRLAGVADGTAFEDAATHVRLVVSGGKLLVPVAGMSGRVLLRV